MQPSDEIGAMIRARVCEATRIDIAAMLPLPKLAIRPAGFFRFEPGDHRAMGDKAASAAWLAAQQSNQDTLRGLEFAEQCLRESGDATNADLVRAHIRKFWRSQAALASRQAQDVAGQRSPRADATGDGRGVDSANPDPERAPSPQQNAGAHRSKRRVEETR